MFDKQKIIAMTAALEEFVRIQPNIFILPEVWSGNLLPLLKRLKANVVGIMTNAPVNPEQNIIQTPSGNYPQVNFSVAIPSFDYRTGIIVSSSKQIANPLFISKFDVGTLSVEVPAFALTDEEAMAIYDRITTLETLKRYKDDGVIANSISDISIRFARGMSTLIDSRYQDLKVQVCERLKSTIRTYDVNPGAIILRHDFKFPKYNVDDAAIVMQGPIEYRNDYTITTARLYREWYPNAPIIISTWKNEPTDAFREECKRINVIILENNLPIEEGVHNVNYQIESSFRGLEYVRKNRLAKYSLKCRTDQRLNRTDFFVYFKNLLKAFPNNGEKLKDRIIVFSVSDWIPFFCCDFCYFGQTEDVYKIFDIPMQTNKEKYFYWRTKSRFQFVEKKIEPLTRFKWNIKFNRKFRNFNILMNKFNPAEVFILKNFYDNHVNPIEGSKLTQIFLKFLRDYLIVVEKDSILLDWPKYQNEESYIIGSMGSYFWLDIYLNYKAEDD